MNKKIIINSTPSETRVALVEDGSLAEIYIERTSRRHIVGNIYRANITRVLPGMQSSFIDIGEERAAFLYGGDVIDPKILNKMNEENSTDFQDARELLTASPIEQVLNQGQDIIVQISKEAIGTKGSRATTFISLPGRFLVLAPGLNHIGISRRIEESAEIDRLKAIVEKHRPSGFGVIVRTAALDISEEQLSAELNYLLKLWQDIDKSKNRQPSPSKIYQEPEIHLKTVRELFSGEIDQIVVDSQEVYDELKRFMEIWKEGSSQKLELFAQDGLIFDEFDLEVEIAKAIRRKVWLSSGGYLVIDQAEALTAFDVNTGKFVGKLSAKETILKTNMEAVKEISAQLRLRNIGGIIVIDFIDMESEGDKEIVYEALEKALKNDKAHTNALKISEFGLVQMTRKRTSNSLEKSLTIDCPHCNALGRVYSCETSAFELLRDLERFVTRTKLKSLVLSVRDDVLRLLKANMHKEFEAILKKHDISVEFEETKLNEKDLSQPAYEILPAD